MLAHSWRLRETVRLVKIANALAFKERILGSLVFRNKSFVVCAGALIALEDFGSAVCRHPYVALSLHSSLFPERSSLFQVGRLV